MKFVFCAAISTVLYGIYKNKLVRTELYWAIQAVHNQNRFQMASLIYINAY